MYIQAFKMLPHSPVLTQNQKNVAALTSPRTKPKKCCHTLPQSENHRPEGSFSKLDQVLGHTNDPYREQVSLQRTFHIWNENSKNNFNDVMKVRRGSIPLNQIDEHSGNLNTLHVRNSE